MHIVKLSCVELVADLKMTFPVNPPAARVERVRLCVTGVVWDPDSTPHAGTSKPLKSKSGGH